MPGWAASGGCSSFWQRGGGRASCKQCPRMAVLRDDSEPEHHLHWALDYQASCREETIVFQYFKNIVTLKLTLELNSMVDIWMLVAFSLQKMFCAKYKFQPSSISK